MFASAISFNQPIDSWNVSNVRNMVDMFRNATALNQPISGWSASSVTAFTGFMTGKTFSNYSTANYDSLLNSWSTKTLKSGLTINFGTIKYTVTGQPGRDVLTGSPYNWIIIDGGL